MSGFDSMFDGPAFSRHVNHAKQLNTARPQAHPKTISQMRGHTDYGGDCMALGEQGDRSFEFRHSRGQLTPTGQMPALNPSRAAAPTHAPNYAPRYVAHNIAATYAPRMLPSGPPRNAQDFGQPGVQLPPSMRAGTDGSDDATFAYRTRTGCAAPVEMTARAQGRQWSWDDSASS